MPFSLQNCCTDLPLRSCWAICSRQYALRSSTVLLVLLLVMSPICDRRARFGRGVHEPLTVFEEGPLGVALVGKDHRFLKVNSALCQMLGYPEETLVQMSFADITHPDDLRADAELAERLFKRELPFYRLQKRY